MPTSADLASLAILAAVCIVAFTVRWARDQRRWVEEHTARLEAAERDVTHLFDEVPDPVVVVDHEGVIVGSNLAAQRLFGCTAEELAGHSMFDCVDARLALAEAVTNAISGALVAPIRMMLELDPQRTIPVEVNTRLPAVGPLFDQDQHLTLQLRDMTETNQRVARLSPGQRDFRQIFQRVAAPMALVRLDDGRIMEANPALARLVGYSRRELMERSWRELAHPHDLAANQAQRAQLELGAIDSVSFDQRYRRRDGSFVATLTSVSIIDGTDGLLAVYYLSAEVEESSSNNHRSEPAEPAAIADNAAATADVDRSSASPTHHRVG